MNPFRWVMTHTTWVVTSKTFEYFAWGNMIAYTGELAFTYFPNHSLELGIAKAHCLINYSFGFLFAMHLRCAIIALVNMSKQLPTSDDLMLKEFNKARDHVEVPRA